jgi:hypothetical protein
MKTPERKVFSDGTIDWVLYDPDHKHAQSDGFILHREDGPARIHTNGTKKWFRYGGFHRIGQPAIEWNSGQREWWIEDKKIGQTENGEDLPLKEILEYAKACREWIKNHPI